MNPDEPLVDVSWIVGHLDDIAYRTAQHAVIAAIAVAVGFAFSFALALWIRRDRRLLAPVTGIASVLYTIPSLAMFVALVPFTGLSLLTAEIPLVIYTLQVLIRSIVSGLDAAPADVREAADAMGYRPGERLRAVDLPLAIPLIVAGLRLATVSTIALVMIVSLIGSNFGGLGVFINEGLQAFFPTKMYVGVTLSIALAILADLAFVRIERVATPWARRRAAVTVQRVPEPGAAA